VDVIGKAWVDFLMKEIAERACSPGSEA
jgi:hypothetical protein